MGIWVIGFLIAILITVVGWSKIQRLGSYENIYGYITFWTIPVYMIIGTILIFLLT